MNVELLLKVKAVILEEPRRIDMNDWGSTWDQSEAGRLGRDLPPCGTTACIAGWAATIDRMGRKRLKTTAGALRSVARHRSLCSAGKEALGLDEQVARELFFDEYWPVDLIERLEDELVGTLAYAAVVAEAIDRFIGCDGDWSAEKAVAP